MSVRSRQRKPPLEDGTVPPWTTASSASRLIAGTGLALRGPEGTVFGPVSFSFGEGDLVVVAGQSGSGRTSLLLALAGRIRGVEGHGRFGNLDLLAQPHGVRRRSSVARIGGLVDLEPQLTVEESVTERALADSVRASAARRTFNELQEQIPLQTPRRRALVGTLSRIDQALLALALACLRPADLIVFDDMDRQLTVDERRTLYAAMLTVTDRGPAVVTAALDTNTVPADTTVIEPRPPGAPRPRSTPVAAPPST